MSPTAGILYVTMNPHSSLSSSRFHDWYNNEHGPTRLKLPQFFANGFRYRAADSAQSSSPEQPGWLAIYDMRNTADVHHSDYTRMRSPGVKSQREIEVMKQIDVDRRVFDLIQEWKGKNFERLEDVKNEGRKNVIISVSLSLNQDYPDAEEELRKWYDGEHIELLSKVPGWRRSRRFVTSKEDPREEREFLALHEYALENGLDGEEFRMAVTSEWSKMIYSQVLKRRTRRVWNWYYTLGPAPRDLESLNAPDTGIFESPRAGETMWGAEAEGSDFSRAVIQSSVITTDGVQLRYRLQGASEPDAPLMVCVNSILVDKSIWDGFIDQWFSTPEGKKWRILSFDARGRGKLASEKDVTLDMLCQDILQLLNTFRAPKAAALIGVSLGGATVLNAALKHPERVERFISCDTNARAPPSNPRSWDERIAMAEKTAAPGGVVGSDLAQATVDRWFVKEHHGSAEFERVKKMVSSNNLEGFKRTAKALYEYDMRDAMKGAIISGLFVAGGGDGVLPNTMKEMAESYGGGKLAELKTVESAGHLPMVEQPGEFCKIVKAFLTGRSR